MAGVVRRRAGDKWCGSPVASSSCCMTGRLTYVRGQIKRTGMKLTLISYERDVLDYIDRELGVERGLLMGFATTLDCLRRLFQDLLADMPEEMKAGRVVLIGLINHTHHLLVGGLQALRDGNGTVWSLCARSLMETFGACVLISERPQTAPNYLTLRNPAGPLRKAAERAQPG